MGVEVETLTHGDGEKSGKNAGAPQGRKIALAQNTSVYVSPAATAG